MCRALARRVGASDIEEFGALWDLRRTLDREVTAAIDVLRGPRGSRGLRSPPRRT